MEAQTTSFVADLRGFPEELAASLRSEVGELETVDRLVALLARIVFRGTAYHAALNYALYDFGYAALQPQAQFGPGPSGQDTEEDWLRMLPPYDIAYEVIEAFYPLRVQINTLGDYGPALSDPALAAPLERFQAHLRAIEAEIEARNTELPWPYTWSLPSQISNSIHV